MTELNISLLKKISETAGTCGYEDEIRNLVLKNINPLVDEVLVDSMGNVIALKKGKSSDKKLMITAHMDELGLMVTHIEDNGFLRFTPLGGFDPKTLVSQRVKVYGKKVLPGVIGGKPVHMMTSEERKAACKIEDLFIDLGLPKKKVEELVEIGDVVVRDRELIELGECVNGKSLDNRVSVFILIEVLKHIKNIAIPYDFYACFTVQEEVGLRGAKVVAHKICPDFGIGLDTTIANDIPGAEPSKKCTKLGEGVAIKVMDSGSIGHSKMVAWLTKTAQNSKIKYQKAVLIGGANDTAAIQAMVPGGCISASVCIPTRHIHQDIESCHKEDIQNTINLITRVIETIDQLR